MELLLILAILAATIVFAVFNKKAATALKVAKEVRAHRRAFVGEKEALLPFLSPETIKALSFKTLLWKIKFCCIAAFSTIIIVDILTLGLVKQVHTLRYPSQWLLHYILGTGKDLTVPKSVMKQARPLFEGRYGAFIKAEEEKNTVCVYSSILYEGSGFHGRPSLFYLVGGFTYTAEVDKDGVLVKLSDHYDWHADQYGRYFTSPIGTGKFISKIATLIFGDYFSSDNSVTGEVGISNKVWEDLKLVGAKEFDTYGELFFVPTKENPFVFKKQSGWIVSSDRGYIWTHRSPEKLQYFYNKTIEDCAYWGDDDSPMIWNYVHKVRNDYWESVPEVLAGTNELQKYFAAAYRKIGKRFVKSVNYDYAHSIGRKKHVFLSLEDDYWKIGVKEEAEDGYCWDITWESEIPTELCNRHGIYYIEDLAMEFDKYMSNFRR